MGFCMFVDIRYEVKLIMLDTFLEQYIYRLRLLFSFEGLCSAGLLWGSHVIADRLNLLPPPHLRWVNYNLFIRYQIGIVVFFFLLFVMVYGTGELVRRKLKLKSLLFFDTRNTETQQKIITLIEKNQDITIRQIADDLWITRDHAKAYIHVLKKAGMVRQEGTWISPRWVLNQNRNDIT